MTIEEKAKAYDKAYERVVIRFGSNIADEIFPELKESDDEKIRQEIITFIKKRDKSGCDYDYNLWLAWLEKQGEQNVADKIKPKFHEGDWVVCGKLFTQITSIENDGYTNSDQGFISFETAKKFHLWTIQDAKAGDVIQLGGVTAIFQEYIGYGNCKCYCSVYNGEFEIPIEDGEDNIYGCTNSTPATKEQSDLLFQKMKEAGFEWDSEKKELKKISQRMISAKAKEAMYDKPTDNDMVEALRTEYEKGKADAFAEMQKEWSKEDEAHINGIIDYLLDYKLFVYEEDMNVANGVQKELDWLETLKQRIG